MDASRLKSISIFEDIADGELAQIATFAQEVSVEAGRQLVREGDFSYEFMAIEEGWPTSAPATSSARWGCSRRPFATRP